MIEFFQGHIFNIVFIALYMYLYNFFFKITPKIEFYQSFEQTIICVCTLEHPRFTCIKILFKIYNS